MSETPKRRSPPKVWRLIVWNVTRDHAPLMARLRLIPSQKKPTTFWREYPAPAKVQVQAACDLLVSAGLHGIARLSQGRRPSLKPPYRPRPAASNREGFGGKLNARPVAGSWRRRMRRK